MNFELSEAIKALRESTSIKQTKVGRIRGLLPDIEAAQQAGVRLAEIAIVLQSHGFEGMDLKCLQNLLYQSRRHRGERRSVTSRSLTRRPQNEHKIESAGIDAELIFEVARQSMSSTAASSITIDLLKSTSTRKGN